MERKENDYRKSSGNETNGVGVDLYEILMTTQQHPFLKGLDFVQEHFWNMFVVDALIGNNIYLFGNCDIVYC